MAFVSVCNKDALREGEIGFFRVNRKSVLLVWPKEGEIKAYRGRCPHQDVPLDRACFFDGTRVVCGIHRFRFDTRTGKGDEPHGCKLTPYALRVEQGELQVDL